MRGYIVNNQFLLYDKLTIVSTYYLQKSSNKIIHISHIILKIIVIKLRVVLYK
jgi:hypothetical protein